MTCWLEVNGVQLRYDRTAGPSGTIVLVHEMGGALESWDGVVPLLTQRGTVLRYDQRGAGLSEKPRSALTIEGAADDLAALVAALGATPPVTIVGAAVGAAVAAAFAARHPAKINALIMLAPATGLTGDRLAAAERRIEKIEKLGIRAAFADEPPDEQSRYSQIRLSADPVGLAATWRMLASLQMDEMLRTIPCPTLVAAGVRDIARPPDLVAAVAAKIPQSRFVVLDTGHVMAIDTPQLAAEVIMDFIDAHCPATAGRTYRIGDDDG